MPARPNNWPNGLARHRRADAAAASCWAAPVNDRAWLLTHDGDAAGRRRMASATPPCVAAPRKGGEPAGLPHRCQKEFWGLALAGGQRAYWIRAPTPRPSCNGRSMRLTWRLLAPAHGGAQPADVFIDLGTGSGAHRPGCCSMSAAMLSVHGRGRQRRRPGRGAQPMPSGWACRCAFQHGSSWLESMRPGRFDVPSSQTRPTSRRRRRAPGRAHARAAVRPWPADADGLADIRADHSPRPPRITWRPAAGCCWSMAGIRLLRCVSCWAVRASKRSKAGATSPESSAAAAGNGPRHLRRCVKKAQAGDAPPVACLIRKPTPCCPASNGPNPLSIQDFLGPYPASFVGDPSAGGFKTRWSGQRGPHDAKIARLHSQERRDERHPTTHRQPSSNPATSCCS
jgi:hypothetical protein